jgi:exopolysaccharide production protein ExoZ
MRIKNIQAMRSLAALLVLTSHLGFIEQRFLPGRALLTPMELVGYSGVDAFFIISGFVMAVTTWTQPHGINAAAQFLLRRATRIYPPYWIVSAAILPVWLAAPSLVNAHAAYPTNVIASFLLLPQRGPQLLLVGWTLVHEMYFYLVFSVLMLCPRRWFAPGLVAWAATIVTLWMVFSPSDVHPFAYVLTRPINLEFCFGIAIGALVARGILATPWACFVVGACAVTASFLIMAGGTDLTGEWTRVFFLGVPFALVIYGLVGLELRHALVAPPWLQATGDASYATYLLHIPVLAIAGRLLSVLAPRSLPLHILALVLSAASVLGAALAFYQFVERPLLKVITSALHITHRRPDLAAAEATS